MLRTIDILSVGEVLIDFIGHQLEESLSKTKDYHRYLGGSPTNLAINASRLGLSTSLVATVGDDGFGNYILYKLKEANVNIDYVTTFSNKPTSVVFVSKTSGTPEFIPFREADSEIYDSQIPTLLLKNTKIFHTTCFALSKNPAQSTILKKAKEAHDLGCKLSIDLNFAGKLWTNKAHAIQVISTYCKLNPLLKISEDDMFRFFGVQKTHEEIFDYFHNLGVDLICLTLGSKGVKLSQKSKDLITMPAVKISKVLDSTGAGDAFWAGFLSAYIKNKDVNKCLETGLDIAALKLQTLGRLPVAINL